MVVLPDHDSEVGTFCHDHVPKEHSHIQFGGCVTDCAVQEMYD